jgi:hypothetical protein
MKGVWMLVDAVIFAIACAVLIVFFTAQAGPTVPMESIALSTSLEDMSFALSQKPDLLQGACTSEGGQVKLREFVKPATDAFPSTEFFLSCPDGNRIALSDVFHAQAPEFFISTNRVITPSDGESFLAVFYAGISG